MAKEAEALAVVRMLLGEILERNISEYDGSARLIEDLGVDSLAVVELSIALDEAGFVVGPWQHSDVEPTLDSFVAHVIRGKSS